VTGPTGEEAFDAAIGEGALNGKGLGQLDIDVVTGGQMITAVDSLFAVGAGMEEGENLSPGIHGVLKMPDDGRHERFRQIVEGGPKQDDVESSAGEIEGLFEVALDIPDGIPVLVDSGLPVDSAGVLHQVGEEDAVPEFREVIDVGGRGVADVDDAQSGLGLQSLAQRRPTSAVAWDAWPGGTGRARQTRR